MDVTKAAKAALAKHAQGVVIPPDKTYRVVIQNDKGEQKFEEFDSRNFSLAYYTAKDFMNMHVRTDFDANWRIVSLTEIK